MQVEPPDRVGRDREDGPCLPGSLAVKASLFESRGARPAGGNPPGEEVGGTGTAAAAKDIMQVEGASNSSMVGMVSGEDFQTVSNGRGWLRRKQSNIPEQ